MDAEVDRIRKIRGKSLLDKVLNAHESEGERDFELEKEFNEVAQVLESELELDNVSIQFRIVPESVLYMLFAFSRSYLDVSDAKREYKELKGNKDVTLFEIVGMEKDGKVYAFLSEKNNKLSNLSSMYHVIGHALINKKNYIHQYVPGNANNIKKEYGETKEFATKFGQDKLKRIVRRARALSLLQNGYPDIYKDSKGKVYNIGKFVIDKAKLNEDERSIYNILLDSYLKSLQLRIKILHEATATFIERKAADVYLEKGKESFYKRMLEWIDNHGHILYLLDIDNLYGSGFPYAAYRLIDNAYHGGGPAEVKRIYTYYDDIKLLSKYFTVDFLKDTFSAISALLGLYSFAGVEDEVINKYKEKLKLYNANLLSTRITAIFLTYAFPIIYTHSEIKDIMVINQVSAKDYFAEHISDLPPESREMLNRSMDGLFRLDYPEMLNAINVAANMLGKPVMLKTFDKNGNRHKIKAIPHSY